MLINLRASTTKEQPQRIEVELVERFPDNIIAPCKVICDYELQPYSDYYLLAMQVSGTIQIQCQRCLGTFEYPYDNSTTLAVCSSEEVAETLMSDYESIVALNNQIDFKELITDELILNCPKKHPDINDCDSEVDRFLIHS